MLWRAPEFTLGPLEGTREKSGSSVGLQSSPWVLLRAPGRGLCPLEGSSLQWRLPRESWRAPEFILGALDGSRERSVYSGELLHAVETPRGRLEGSRVYPGYSGGLQGEVCVLWKAPKFIQAPLDCSREKSVSTGGRQSSSWLIWMAPGRGLCALEGPSLQLRLPGEGWSAPGWIVGPLEGSRVHPGSSGLLQGEVCVHWRVPESILAPLEGSRETSVCSGGLQPAVEAPCFRQEGSRMDR